MLSGYRVAIEYPAALLTAVMGIYGLWIALRGHGSTLNRAILYGMWLLGLGIGGALLISYNVSAFDNVFYIPYEAYSTPGFRLPFKLRRYLDGVALG